MKYSLLLLILLLSFSAAQDYNFADSLSEPQKALLDSVAKDVKISDNCRGSIEKNRNSIACPEAEQFYNFAAWYAMNDKPYDYIVDKIRRRDATFFSPEKYEISPSYNTVAGDTSAPIHIIAYVSSDCPHCKKVGIPLYELVEGPLRGDASFAIKPIHHKIGDYALLAAKEQGKDWDLFKAYGDIYERLNETLVLQAAEEAKIDVERLKKDVDENNERYQKIISDNYTEAKRNGLKFTPTLYFNGYKYDSNKHPIWLIDYIKFLTRTGKAN